MKCFCRWWHNGEVNYPDYLNRATVTGSSVVIFPILISISCDANGNLVLSVCLSYLAAVLTLLITASTVFHIQMFFSDNKGALSDRRISVIYITTLVPCLNVESASFRSVIHAAYDFEDPWFCLPYAPSLDPVFRLQEGEWYGKRGITTYCNGWYT